MRNKITFLYCLFFTLVLFYHKAKAQDMLTLEEVVRIALENNYDIKLISNNLAINKNNVSMGNAGLLPVVNGTVTNNNSIQNSRQTQANGTVQERKNAKNASLNYGVGLNWKIFDGFGMFARYDQLQKLEELGEQNLQLTILTKVSDVITIYYDLVQQQQQLRALDTAIAISRLRIQTAQNRFDVGKAGRLELLNAKVDFNTDTTSLLRQQELYINTRIRLNEQLARDVNVKFKVADSIVIDDKLNIDQLSTLTLQQNPSLKAALINKRIAELDLKQVRANRYPVINVSTGYNFNNSQSALGFATQTSGKGFTYGVSASINIFNGFTQRKNERNAFILIENSRVEYERLNENISAQLSTAYQTYLTNLSLVQLEENNQKIAQQNLEITLDKFRLGSITPIQVREAQLNYVNAKVRFSNALHEAKLAEIFLKEISGSLVL